MFFTDTYNFFDCYKITLNRLEVGIWLHSAVSQSQFWQFCLPNSVSEISNVKTDKSQECVNVSNVSSASWYQPSSSWHHWSFLLIFPLIGGPVPFSELTQGHQSYVPKVFSLETDFFTNEKQATPWHHLLGGREWESHPSSGSKPRLT